MDILKNVDLYIFEYSVILGFLQYDFGNKDKRILIEIQGDYWHANPKFFGDGIGLRPLTTRQLEKIQKDITKKEFAQKHGIKLLCFWENDIKNNPQKIIDEVKNAIDSV